MRPDVVATNVGGLGLDAVATNVGGLGISVEEVTGLGLVLSSVWHESYEYSIV